MTTKQTNGDGVASSEPSVTTSESPWYSGFNDDLRGYVENKGWRDPAATVESYRNLEKLHGVPPEQIIKLPKDGASPEEWTKVWERLGRPADASEYKIPTSEDGDTRFGDWARGVFHELGIPKSMADKLSEKYMEFSQSMVSKQSEDYSATIAAQTSELKKEWGMAFDQNVNTAKAAVRGLGIDAATIDALEKSMGFSKVMQLFHSIGEKTGEGSFISGSESTSFGVMSPAAAASKIAALKSDKEWATKYLSGDKTAAKEMQQLLEWANPSNT